MAASRSPQQLRPQPGENPSLFLILIRTLKKAALLLLGLFSNQAQAGAQPSYGRSHPTVELLIFFHSYSLSFLFFRALSPLCYWLSIIRPVHKTDATFFFRSPKFNLGLRRSINSHLCAGDTCRSFYCGAEGNASCAAGLHGSPIRSIIKDTPATELIKKYIPQLLLAWPCLFLN